MTVSLMLAVMMMACESQISDKPTSNDPNSLLQVDVKGLKSMTRSAIIGDTLPDSSHFSLYLTKANSTTLIDEAFNVDTFYSNGKCELSQNVSLNGVGDAFVYAFYPYSLYGHPYEMKIDAMSQTDYLWGRGEDANGNQAYVNENQPKASIAFEHIMALISLRIHRSADNNSDYYIPSIDLYGDGENQFREAYINVLEREFIWKGYSQYDPIVATLSTTTLDENNDLILADFLVIPSKTQWGLRVNFSGEYQYFWDVLPEIDYQSGQRYIYDCTISGNDSIYLTIEKCEILPWENTEMPGYELK